MVQQSRICRNEIIDLHWKVNYNENRLHIIVQNFLFDFMFSYNFKAIGNSCIYMHLEK